MSSGKRSVAGSVRGAGENGPAESSKERDGMRGMVEGRRPVRIGAVLPCTVDGAAGGRPRVGWPTLAIVWASTMA